MNTDYDATTAPAIVSERRRRPRYRFSAQMTIFTADGAAMSAISVDISESGMSAVADGLLKVGETVELEPVAGGKLSALVRHKLGGLYGFEFVSPGAEQVRRIAENCRMLGRHRSSARSS
jgi:hypothetical protein